jgi:ElaB/YqjD/DUF883 family membrane-anchored ribosome-binding protein
MHAPVTPDEEMFDDIHLGVEALRSAAKSSATSLTPRVMETIQRLETSVPAARSHWNTWKRRITHRALQAAQKTDVAIRDSPWAFAVGALALGVVAGWLISGSDRESSESQI